MTRIYGYPKEFIEALKFVPAQKVERCPIPYLSDVYEIYGRALARRRNPHLNLSGHPLQERLDRAIESTILVDDNGEPCLGESCIFYGVMEKKPCGVSGLYGVNGQKKKDIN